MTYNFMTDVVSLEYYRAVASAVGAKENLSWYSVLNIYHKIPKFVDIEPGLLELFENVTGVRFFETQCILYLC